MAGNEVERPPAESLEAVLGRLRRRATKARAVRLGLVLSPDEADIVSAALLEKLGKDPESNVG